LFSYLFLFEGFYLLIDHGDPFSKPPTGDRSYQEKNQDDVPCIKASRGNFLIHLDRFDFVSQMFNRAPGKSKYWMGTMKGQGRGQIGDTG
jgi:hypothetical protein